MTGWVERYYGWLALILVAIVVGATCWPVIVYPQLDPDEYRYLALLQAAGDAAGSAGDAAAGWMERALVENRWDHLWWIADRDPVRFWRPTVLASFAVDRAIWGREGVEFGLCLSNVLIYTSMCLVFAAVLGRAFGRSWTSLVALGLFAAFFAHGEAIWYVSGRNETIAGFFALLAWWLHLRGGLWRYGGALAFLLALMTKELVIGLPLLLLVQEAWLRREELGESDGAGADAVAQRWSGLLRAAWPWLLAYGAAVLLWFALRAMALDGRSAGGASYPYFISPLGGGFVAHLWAQLRTYSENLLFATGTPPFAELGELEAYGLELWRTVVALGLAGGLLVWLRRERAAWFCALFVFVTWLPTSFVYVSERYLMLPSVGIAGLVAVALGRLRGAPLQLAGLLLVLLWAGHQAYMLQGEECRVDVAAARAAGAEPGAGSERARAPGVAASLDRELSRGLAARTVLRAAAAGALWSAGATCEDPLAPVARRPKRHGANFASRRRAQSGAALESRAHAGAGDVAEIPLGADAAWDSGGARPARARRRGLGRGWGDRERCTVRAGRGLRGCGDLDLCAGSGAAFTEPVKRAGARGRAFRAGAVVGLGPIGRGKARALLTLEMKTAERCREVTRKAPVRDIPDNQDIFQR
jgi:hypothetical protein